MSAAGRRRLKNAGVLLVFFLLVISVVSFAVLHCIYQMSFPRYDVRDSSPGYLYHEISSEYPREEVSFQSGGNTLTGSIYGKQNTKGLIVFSHGLEGGADDYLAMQMYFIDRGWRVFAFDNTGSCRSEGKSVVGHAQSAVDLENALRYIAANPEFDGLEVMLFGHSWGGYAVSAVLNAEHKIAASVSASGYDTPMQQMYYQMKLKLGAFAPFEYPFLWMYMHLRFGGLADYSAVEGINQSSAKSLVLQGTDDPFYGEVSSIYANRHKITNPECTIWTMDQPGRNGHMDYFYSEDAVAYQKEMTARYPDREERSRSVDKHKWNEINHELFDAIDRFFENSLSQ